MLEKYLEFLRFSIDDNYPCPKELDNMDWEGLYDFSKRQSLLGVVYRGIERIGKNVKIPKPVLLKWYSVSEQIKKRNIIMNKYSEAVADKFRELGFRNCILKGQGIATNYPDTYARTPGDIDIWLEGGRKKIMSFVKQKWPHLRMRYHHVELPPIKGVQIEIHFTPSYMHSPFANHHLQKWFSEQADMQFSNYVVLPDCKGHISVPTLAFNRIYILEHIYRHLFSEGIGMRQLLDYYYVLKQEKSDIEKDLKRIGLYKFAKAVMYIMQQVFGLSEEYLVAKPDEKEGKYLLREILLSGNFGYYDNRLGRCKEESYVHRYFRMTWRNLYYARHYPSEALSEPIFRTCQFFWGFFNK